MPNTLVWMDIPVVELDRAIAFYSAVLGEQISKQEYGTFAIGLLPGAEESVSGCLFIAEKEEAKPAVGGPLVYLNCSGRLDEAEAAVEPSGGKVLQSKHAIAPHGFRSVILDSEGNRIALHSI